MAVTFTLTEEEKSLLGVIACSAIDQILQGKTSVDLPFIPQGVLHETLGCFVTLNKNGRLRGCIGTMVAQEPLHITAVRMACAAALHDNRFPPLTREEWESAGAGRVEVELSVLGPMSLCPGKEHIQIGTHGLLLTLHGKSGVFLPKVPVEQGWDLDTYLTQLCHKASLPVNSWQHKDAQLFYYEALVFSVPRVQGSKGHVLQ